MATNDKLSDEQAAKKKIWIKGLYFLFIGKDSLLKLALFLFDCALVSDNLELKYMQISDGAGTIFTVAIHLVVPAALVTSILMKCSPKNPLQRLLFYQAIIVTIITLLDFAVIAVFLMVDHRRSIHFLIKLLDVTSMALPLIIQATTIICFKKN
ncbi:hypothetical protein CRE_16128 [Caenorhabditis remanei]|uniref:Uncharacterized protein n=1 Tax=Caenorhabditis remanei TaxID=31234 RepID=E3MB69_CAERE|nr:hypothetical protein CRE_16128 [Caenorhabditis remanei]